MEMKNIAQPIKNLGGVITKNSSTILTLMAVTGVFTTVAFAITATPKALRIIDDEYELRKEDSITGSVEILTKREVLKLTWKCYIPAAGLALATVACVIGANHISQRRNAALASLLGITEVAFKEYQEKVVETIGRNKEQRVRDDICEDRIKQNPVSMHNVFYTGKGDQLCFDSMSGQYFKSDSEMIRRAVNELNKELLTDTWVSLNDLYYALGLNSCRLGDLMGWSISSDYLEINFTSQVAENGVACLVLNYSVQPKYYKRGE